MSEQGRDSADHMPGDKVRIRIGPNAGRRGRIRAVSDAEIELELDDGTLTSVQSSEITNYSRAARKAWLVMPKRAGRPRLDDSKRKKMVSVRIDRDLWEQLGNATDRGLVSSREAAINAWLRRNLDDLLSHQPFTNGEVRNQGDLKDAEDTNS